MNNFVTCLPRSIACLLFAWALQANAQSEVDPTRPPGGIGSPGDAIGAATVTDAPASGLQAVFVRDKPGMSGALINGQMVTVGGRVGESRLLSVASDHIVLIGGQGKEVMRLTPFATKVSSVAAKPAPAIEKRKQK